MDIPYFLGLSLVYDAWLRSGVFFDSGAVYCLDSADGGYFGAHDRYAVRPALLNCNKLKKVVDIPYFWSYRPHV